MDKIGKLIADLDSADAGTRLNAAEDLIDDNDRRAVQPLIGKLSSATWEMKMRAAQALGNIGDPSACQTLIDVMEKRDWMDSDNEVPALVGGVFAEALGKIGDRRAVEPLCMICSDDDHDLITDYVATALGRLGDERAVPTLIEKFENLYWIDNYEGDDSLVCCAHALGEIGHEDALEPLVYHLRFFIDNWIDDRACAREDFRVHIIFAEIAWALGMIGGASAFDILIEAMVYLYIPEHPPRGREMRSKAAEALSSFDNPDAVEPLLKKMNDKKEHQEVRISAIRSLGELAGEIGGISPDPFIAVLRDPQLMPMNLRREEAVKALGMIGHDKAVDPLAELLWEREQYLALPAASSLVQIGNSRARQALEKFLEDSDDSEADLPQAITRAAVAEQLGEMGDRRSVDLLIENLDDWNGDVRAAAASALGFIGDERAEEQLIKLLKREATRDFADDRAAAAEALGVIERAGHAGKPLMEAMEDKSVKVRIAAASALGRYSGTVPAMMLLISFLDDDSWDVQDAAEESLERMINSSNMRERIIRDRLNKDDMKTITEKLEQFQQWKGLRKHPWRR